MIPDEMRIAIALSLGWTLVNPTEPNPRFQSWWPPGTKPIRNCYSTEKPPDYCNDLNAMHEVEKYGLSYDLGAYICYLEEATSTKCAVPHACPSNPDRFALIHATAHQRAEAYLRTKGLWK